MGDLSVKGVLRRHLGITGNILLTPILQPLALLHAPAAFPDVPLRAVLEGVARTEHEHERHDHPYTWNAKYEQTWTHIRVRIELKPKNDAAENAIDGGLRTVWKNGIESAWNGRFSARAGGELACRFSFEAVFTDDDPHHKVHVDDESIPTNLSDWDIFDPGSTAAHEFGHMIGKFDEYVDEEVPGREHVLTGTIMEDNSSNFTPRMFTRFARNILCFVTDETGTTIPKPY
jgi:hypothetical protein